MQINESFSDVKIQGICILSDLAIRNVTSVDKQDFSFSLIEEGGNTLFILVYL